MDGVVSLTEELRRGPEAGVLLLIYTSQVDRRRGSITQSSGAVSVKVEVAVLDSLPLHNSPCGLCGCKATLDEEEVVLLTFGSKAEGWGGSVCVCVLSLIHI